MRKLRLFLAAFAVLFGMSAYAQSWTGSYVGEGEYYLYNVGKAQFFTKGNGWGTQASTTSDFNGALIEQLIPEGSYYVLRPLAGVFSDSSWGLEHLSGGTVYTDQSRGKLSTWEFVQNGTYGNGSPLYNIISQENHGGGAGAYLTANAENTIVGPGTDSETDYAKWILLTSDQAEILGVQLALSSYRDNYNAMKEKVLTFGDVDVSAADELANSAVDEAGFIEAINALRQAAANYLSTANITEPIDITNVWITNPAPGISGNLDGWTNSGNPSLQAQLYEYWNVSGGSTSQTINYLPKGAYKLTAIAYTRDNMFATLYAGENQMYIAGVASNVVNNRTEGSNWIAQGNGNGVNELSFTLDNDAESLEFGLIADNTTADYWMCWRSFNLTFYGDPLTKAKAEFDEAVVAAGMIEEGSVPASVYSSLQDILSQYNQTYSTVEEYEAAAQAIKAAVANAQIYVAANNVLPQMKELTELTNVYTEEAYNEYYGQWIAKYEAAELTAEEVAALQNPFVVTGWHANITCDNFLLSAWDTNPDFQEAPYYINTWSVEGENDGTNFKVPFFEYFAGDENVLGERTLTATMNNVPEGVYNVTALVRVRVYNTDDEAADAYGITLQVNDGDAANACDGDASSTSYPRFRLKEVTAQGTVGADGVLKIKFNVAGSNNVSWLSFKNVKFEKAVAPVVFPEGAVVYDFEAAAAAGENPANKNGSAANGQAFYGWEKADKTDSKRQDYKGYEWAEGSVLPEICHVWRRSDRINGNVTEGGLKCPSDKEMAVDGLQADSKVIIVYDATAANDDSKNIIWAIGDGTSEGGPGAPRATATIDGVQAVTGETIIPSGAEIVINTVIPAENGSGYIVFQVKKNMIIKQIAIVNGITTGIATVNTTNPQLNVVYDLQGRRVAQPTKGLYIINGKKVVK